MRLVTIPHKTQEPGTFCPPTHCRSWSVSVEEAAASNITNKQNDNSLIILQREGKNYGLKVAAVRESLSIIPTITSQLVAVCEEIWRHLRC